MNERPKKFAELYAANGNAAEEARKAGYSCRTARSIGQRLLTDVDIANYVRELQEQMESERIADAQEVKSILTDIVRDEGAKRSDRIKAGGLLLKTAGEMVQICRTGRSSDADIDVSRDMVVQLPYNCDNSIINALQLENGEVVPMLGAEDADVFTYLPYKWLKAMREDDLLC